MDNIVEHENTQRDKEYTAASEIQKRLEQIHSELVCPYCGSTNFIKSGKYNGIQRYKCASNTCKKTFSRMTGTLFENNRWSWEFWVRLLHLILNRSSIIEATKILADEFGSSSLTTKSIYLARHKLIHAMACMPMPKLSGTVRIDETYIRENQKGTRTDILNEGGENIYPLTNVIPDFMTARIPRYTRQPSFLGVASPEYICILSAIDNRGLVVSKVTNLGILSLEQMEQNFNSHLDSADYICTDANIVYLQYCRKYKIKHYVFPSNFLSALCKNGYDFSNGIAFRSPEEEKIVKRFVRSFRKGLLRDSYGSRLYVKRVDRMHLNFNLDAMSQNNRKIVEELYYNKQLDYIDETPLRSFDEFCKTKELNKLNKYMINEYHDWILTSLDINPSGSATKHMPDYICALAYMHNWSVYNAKQPQTMEDAEAILCDIVKSGTNLTMRELQERSVFIAPTPSKEFLEELDDKTRRIRKTTNNKFFKFDEEDQFLNFSIESYLNTVPESTLRRIAVSHKVPKASEMTYEQLYAAVLLLPDVEQLVFRMVSEEKMYGVYAEDMKYLMEHHLEEFHLSYSRNIRGTIIENQSILKSSIHQKMRRAKDKGQKGSSENKN